MGGRLVVASGALGFPFQTHSDIGPRPGDPQAARFRAARSVQARCRDIDALWAGPAQVVQREI